MKWNRTHKTTWIVTAIFLLYSGLTGVYAQEGDPDPFGELFEGVWSIIAAEYAGLYAGIDWFEAREIYEPRVRQAADEEEAYRHLQEMVARLGDPGTFIRTPQEMEQLQAPTPERYSGVGLMLSQLLEDQFVVVEVFNRGPADRAGIRKGARITAVDGLSTSGRGLDEIVEMIKGPAGTTTHLTILEPSGSEKTISVRRAQVEAKSEVTSRRLPDNIGYISLPSLRDGIEVNFLSHLRQMYRTRALIIDLRRFDGIASLKALTRIAGLLTDQPLAGVLTRQGGFAIPADRAWEGGTGVFSVPPPTRLDFYDEAKPIAFLVDRNVALSPLSLALVSGLQLSGRAGIIGRSVPPDLSVGTGQVYLELPGGGLMSVTTSLLVTLSDGDLIHAVEPDVEIDYDLDYLSAWYAGGDLDIEAAQDWLRAVLN